MFTLPLLAADPADLSNPLDLTQPVNATPWQNKIDPWVLETATDGETEFLIFLAEQAELGPAAALPTKLEKGRYVYQTLTATAERTQGPVLAVLQASGIPYRPYWVANMIWVRGDLATVQALARRADVAHIYANPPVHLEEPIARGPETLAGPDAVEPAAIEWNITKVNAPSVWAAGFTGQGAVIAGQDTGYQWDHPALKGKYRGWNGIVASHDYNWHDAIHSGSTSCGVNASAPCDDNQHGTHTMGTMVGDDGVGNQVGMAPGAQWIGCRNMAEGVGTPTTYSECYQWFIAPTRIDGTLPDPSKAPDVINNSWGCPPSEGCTSPNVLLTVVQNVRAAGIVTVHSAGNSGSSCSTVNEPAAIYAESFSVGATNSSDSIASFSSRGPVTVDGSNRLKPNVSAPGVSIRSSIPGSMYEGGWQGTSMAGPHVAGLVALIISADPAVAGQVDYIEDIIERTAVPRTTTQTCGGVPGSAIPNNTYGWGRIDALAAYNLLRNPFTVGAAPSTLDVCAPANGVVTVGISSQVASFQGPVALSASGYPAGAVATFNPNPVVPTGNSTLTIGETDAAAPGSYTVVVTGAAGAASVQTSFTLSLSSIAPAAPALVLPADGSTDQPLSLTFTWSTVSQAKNYDIQIATDPAFAVLAASATGLTTTSFTPKVLASDTVYYWRVQAHNACGSGLSAIHAFRTAPAIAADFSDLASSYGVAWHTGGETLKLGSARTDDSSFGEGHDDAIVGDGSDDGVANAANAYWDGGRGAFELTASAPGCLDAWMDFGDGTGVGQTYADGDFADSYGVISEHVVQSYLVEGGANNLRFDVPQGILGSSSRTYAFRFRLTARGDSSGCAGVSPYGAAAAGEVEDYRITFGPLAVTLASFTADAQASDVTLSWETVSEQDNAGFYLYRADQAPIGSGEPCQLCEWLQINTTLIPAAAPGSSEGHTYTWTDTTVAPGAAYWYVLEDVALDGTRTRHAPISAVVAAPNALGVSGFGAVATGSSLAGLALIGALISATCAALAGTRLRRQR